MWIVNGRYTKIHTNVFIMKKKKIDGMAKKAFSSTTDRKTNKLIFTLWQKGNFKSSRPRVFNCPVAPLVVGCCSPFRCTNVKRSRHNHTFRGIDTKFLALLFLICNFEKILIMLNRTRVDGWLALNI